VYGGVWVCVYSGDGKKVLISIGKRSHIKNINYHVEHQLYIFN